MTPREGALDELSDDNWPLNERLTTQEKELFLTLNQLQESERHSDTIDLTLWRKYMMKRAQEYYGPKYVDLLERTELFLKEECKESPREVELPCGLSIDKKLFSIDLFGPDFQDEGKYHGKNIFREVFEYEYHDYTSRHTTLTGLKQRVLYEEQNLMYEAVQEYIGHRTSEGYRTLTKHDLDTMFEVIPGQNEEEKLFILQMISGWYGRALLDAKEDYNWQLKHRWFASLVRTIEKRKIFTEFYLSSYGSLFFVKDV